MPSSSPEHPRSTSPQRRERSKAAAWAWFEHGTSVSGSLCAASSTALMVRGKYLKSKGGSRRHDNTESSGTVELINARKNRCLPPSRFKQEADNPASRRRSGASAQYSSSPHDEEVGCSDHELSHYMLSGSGHGTQHLAEAHYASHISTSSANHASAASSCPPSTSSHPSAPSHIHRPADDPPHRSRWLDGLFGISSSSSRKSTSSPYVDSELGSLISVLFRQDSASQLRSSLFDSFELQAMLRGLGPYEGAHNIERTQEALHHSMVEEDGVADAEAAHDRGDIKEARAHGLAEVAHNQGLKKSLHHVLQLDDPALRLSQTPERSPIAENLSGKLTLEGRHSASSMAVESAIDMPVSNCDTPAVVTRNKQTLHDLLQWSPHSSSRTLDCNCCSEAVCDNEHYYYSESPDINTVSPCNNISCNTAKAAQYRQRRPSLLMPHLSHSFSNALQHFPHLSHSFSHALHHLPHSLSNALHHLPHLPHSLSNAFHQVAQLTHSLSSAYKHHAHRNHDVEARSLACHDAHVNTHKPSPLRQFFSFKTHHSSPHSDVAVGGTSPTAHSQSSPLPPAMLVHHHSKSPSPCREQRLSASNDYMLIYSSSNKLSSKGIVHHHYHHHYHHYHYIS